MASVVWTRVAVHDAIEKPDGVVFHCTLSASAADRWLEVPAWMFERATCADASSVVTVPFDSMGALSALADLLQQALAAGVGTLEYAAFGRLQDLSRPDLGRGP